MNPPLISRTMKTIFPLSPALPCGTYWLALLLLLGGVTPGLHADIVFCDNWAYQNGNKNPPAQTQKFGESVYDPYTINNAPMAGSLLLGDSDSYGAIVFPNPSNLPNLTLDGLSASFDFDLFAASDGKAADGVAFNFAPNNLANYTEHGSMNAGLAVSFIVNTYNQHDWGTLNVYYNGQPVDTYKFQDSNPSLVRTGESGGNPLPAGCHGGTHFWMRIDPSGVLSWQVQIRNLSDCGFLYSTDVHTIPLGPNALSNTNWQAWFSGRSGNGSMIAYVDNVDIRGYVSPKLSFIPALLTADQDQPGSVALNLSSPDPTWPVENVVVQAYADDHTQIPTNNISVTGSGASRQLTFQGATHQYGTNNLNVLVYYPGATWTNVYTIPVSIAPNIPPTIGDLPANVTVRQGRSLAIPFTYHTTQWSLSRQITVAAVETGALGQQYSVHLLQPDSIPDGPGTANGVVTFTPKLNTSGNTAITVTVTDGVGAQAVSTMNVAVVPQNHAPSVAGERTALSFNETSGNGMQYAFDPGGIGALSNHFTIEAWVRPAMLPVSEWNPIVSLGAGVQSQFAMLAIQNNGIPAFAGYGINSIPTSGPTTPLNGWSHVAVAVQDQTVQLYLNGQLFNTTVLRQAMNVQNGGFAIGFDTANLNAFHGQIDEVRIWNVTRSATEIQNNFRSKVSPVTPGLVRYYDFDGDFYDFTTPYGIIAYDSAATVRTLALTNLPAYVPGVAMDTVFNTPQNAAVSLPVVAQNVQGNNWYGTAGALREAFIGFGATSVNEATNSNPNYPANPYIITLLSDVVEVGPGGMVNGVERLRGYLLPPQSGNYTLWIASHFEGQLWVSPDDNPANKALVATSPDNGAGFRQFTANPSQKTAPLAMTAGNRYYFEVVHASLDGGLGNPTYVSLQWQLPDGVVESPLPAYRVQPPAQTAGTNGPLQIVLTVPPDNGTASINDSVLTYTPTPYYFGTDDLFYYVVDAGRTSAPAHLVFNVNNTLTNPVAGNNNALYFDGVSGRIQSDSTLTLSNRSFTLEAWAARANRSQSVLSYNGINQYIMVTNFGTIAPTNEVTVEFWVKPRRFKNQSAFLANPFIDQNRFNVHINYGDQQSYFDFGNIDGGGRLVAPAFPTNVWTHCALVASQSGNYMSLYTNGVLAATKAGMTPFSRGNYDLTIGGDIPGYLSFDGSLYDFRVWQRARSATEIQAGMLNPLQGNEADLLLYYQFDAPRNDFVPNLATASGPAFNAGLVNGPAYLAGDVPFSTTREWLITQGSAYQNGGLAFGWDSFPVQSGFKFSSWSDWDLQTATPFTDTNWHHWAATFEVATMTRSIYLDGLLVAQDVTTNVLQAPTGPLHIGSQFGGAPFFRGSISEVRVWDHARTAQEIQLAMNTPLQGNEDGLMLYYRLNEGNGLTVTDSSSASGYQVPVSGSISGGITWLTNNTFFGTVTVPRFVGQVYIVNKIYLPGFDPAGSQLTYFLLGGNTNGTASLPDSGQPYVNYQPNLNAKGGDILRYQVRNGAKTYSSIATIRIIISETNVPPTLDAFLDQVVEEEDPPLTLTFAVADIDIPASSLVVTGFCSNPTLLPPGSITVGGSGNTRTVTLKPADGEIGQGTVVITVSDGQLTANQQFNYEVKGRLAFAPVDLGVLTGQPYSEANNINAAGQVVGFTATDNQQSHRQGFVYTGFGPVAQVLPAGTLGGDGSVLNGINRAGLSVGWSVVSGGTATNVIVATQGPPVTLTNRGTMVASTASAATAINDDGYLTGYGVVGGGVTHAFFAGPTGGLVDIGMPTNANQAFGLAINNGETIAGYSIAPGTGQAEGFIYNTSTTNFTMLFAPAGNLGSVATSINDANEVGGYFYTANGDMHAAIALDSSWTDLGDVLGGGAAKLLDLNSLRQGVGTARDPNGNWRAFYYENGRTYDLNSLLPLASGWTLTEARAINDQAQIVGVGQKDGQTKAFLLFPASEIGRRVFRPAGTLPTMPQVTLLQGNPGDNGLNSFFWSANDQKLFAIRPVAALVNWHTGQYTTYTNETQFGDQVIRQIFTNEVMIPTFSYNVWPRDPNLQVASAPVELQPPFPGFNYSFIEMIYSTVDGAAVDNNKVFNTPYGFTGFSVFRYLISNGQAANPQLQKVKFNVTRTTGWDDPDFLETNLAATVGMVLTNAAHNDYPGRNGWMMFTNSYYDGVGANAAYGRTNRGGNIIPVNAVTNRDNFVVAWYDKDLLGVAWPSLPKKYRLQWPTNATHLVIASGLGSGPVNPTFYPNYSIYNQPDVTQAGFNPNEEHALLLADPSGTGATVYALRSDLNAARPGVPSDSAPFVLLKYQDPATQLWRIKMFQVVAEEDPYHFVYSGTAGTQIRPPYPLSLLPQSSSTYAASGPAWEDYAGRFYALAGGENLTNSSIVMRYFYPLQPTFWYDLNNDGSNDLPAGASVPWLSLLNQDQEVNQPIDVTYYIGWPADVPTLAVGETLYGATDGLPDIADMASVQIAYDSLASILATYGIDGITQLARLFDPMSPRMVPVSDTSIFGSVNVAAADISTGFQTFPDLPYYLRVRLYYDPTAQKLCFKGFQQAQTAGQPLNLINVMSPRERNRIQQLDGTNGTTAFDALIQKLYVMTRNPNQLDLQPRDGQPDDALYIGLTYDATGTNVTFEKLGAGPKALTAGIPQWNSQFADGEWLYFDDSSLHKSIEFTRTNAFANVTNNFTIEFWARPASTAGRYSTIETNVGIENSTGGRFAIMPNQGDQAYGYGHATAGISIGNNGVSVFQHSANYLVSPLVYDTPITNWTHVAVSYTNGRASLYLNGVLVRVGLPLATSIISYVHPGIGIGGSQLRTDFGWYSGDLDEIRVWNYTVPAAQIQARMYQQLSGYENGLVGYWPLNEGAGTAVADHSTNHLAGTIYYDGTVFDQAWVAGPGPVYVSPRYQVIAENNDPSLPGQPVSLHVIQVGTGPYQGSLLSILPDNVMDQRVTLRHSADFGGDPSQLQFDWYYHPATSNQPPTLPDPANPAANGWIPFPMDPNSGLGVNDVTIGEGNLSSLITMSDNWFIMRYRGYVINGSTNWSPWVGDPSGSITTPRPMLVEGWIKRVLSGVNLFDQRNTDFENFPVNTLVSSIAQAGDRYEGDIALNPGSLDAPGLIQIYQTILNRGLTLSANGTPPVDYAPANQALLLAAGNISDLYMLVGNEASADAADPTIGLNPALPDNGSLAASMFAFENQVSSLLEEELCLLRGRDDSSAGVGAAPVYNRLFWNFTGSDGEVAYAATYNLSDYNDDGFINALDASILYPQGHGDAWGHYLTALTTYYGLLRNPNFTWTPQTEDVVLGGVALEVGYTHERKFAAAAAALAQTGAKILDRAYRWDYSTAPAGLWAGYKDANLQRAWGTTEWGWRAGSGAYFDWLTGNALLPAVDNTHTGIEKIDRTTVPELSAVADAGNQIQTTLDNVDRGYNPLGLSPNAVPFDLDPTQLLGTIYRKTHFDQVYERALTAVQNAATTFHQASELTDALRAQADDESNFGTAVMQQELAYRNQLIGFFGYPYAADIGPNAPNPSGYVGPDLYHWMYIDVTDSTPQNNAPGTNFTALYQPFQDTANKWGFQFSADTTNALAANSNSFLQVNYPVATAGYLFQAPSTWGSRRAEGSLQTALRNLVQTKVSYQQAVVAYNQNVTAINGQLNLMEARFNLNASQIDIANTRLGMASYFNAAIALTQGAQLFADQLSSTTEKITLAAVEAVPGVEGVAVDALSSVRGALEGASIVPTTTYGTLKNIAAGAQDLLEIGKDEMDLVLAVQSQTAQNTFDQTNAVTDLQGLVRGEVGLRLSLFQQAEALQQAVQNYFTTLAQAQQTLEQRVVYRQITAGNTSEMRYRDLAFRIFRNDALEQYDTQFSLAARYVFLAAKAFDYEINLDTAGAGDLATSVVSERNLGQIQNGIPSASRDGLASILARLKQNFDVLKPSLGLNNTHDEVAQFSLRTEWQRITNSASWLALLQNSAVSNLWDVPEFRQYCRPFAAEATGPQPGIVLEIPGTVIAAGQNFFGRPLAAQDYSYDPSEFSTRIRSVAVWFTGYDSTTLARSPRVYLIPVGADILRSPDALDFTPRSWQVVEQKIPIPFPITSSSSSSLLPDTLNLSDQFADWARHSAFRAYPDAGYDPNNFNPSTRLIGRSVANTRWLLIIPGTYLNGDPNQGISDFVHSVSDIKLYFQTYSASGN